MWSAEFSTIGKTVFWLSWAEARVVFEIVFVLIHPYENFSRRRR